VTGTPDSPRHPDRRYLVMYQMTFDSPVRPWDNVPRNEKDAVAERHRLASNPCLFGVFWLRPVEGN
jgi:hypothetical protein